MEAAELLAEWERDFVNWWNANVGVRHAAGGQKNADLRSSLSLAVRGRKPLTARVKS